MIPLINHHHSVRSQGSVVIICPDHTETDRIKLRLSQLDEATSALSFSSCTASALPSCNAATASWKPLAG